MATDKSFGCRFANTEKCDDICSKCELFHRDCISREAAVEALRPYKVDQFKIGFLDDTIDGFNDGIDTAISCISVEVPAADVRPVVRGTWEDINLGWAQCTNCKLFVIGSREKSQYRFCPNCGADMMEETDGRKD